MFFQKPPQFDWLMEKDQRILINDVVNRPKCSKVVEI